MTINIENFWQAFEQRDFENAQKLFESLPDREKQAIFAALFQQAMLQKTPQLVSVLFRELHEGKNFNDFHEHWLPAAEDMNPVRVDGQEYKQFFPVPTRVINAVNMENPREIVSVGLQWVREEEVPMLLEFVNGQNNNERADHIDAVAMKTKSAVYLTQSDDNLGVPFTKMADKLFVI